MTLQDNNAATSKSANQARRQFWQYMIGTILNLGDSLKGIHQQSLENIGQVPEAVLCEMIPVWMEGMLMDLREDGLYQQSEKGETVCVYFFAEHEKAIVDQFNCGRNLKVISDHLVKDTNMERSAAFNTTKALFVHFCQRGWCHPAAAHFLFEGECP